MDESTNFTAPMPLCKRLDPSAQNSLKKLLCDATTTVDVIVPCRRAVRDSDICDWFESIFEEYKHRDEASTISDVSELLWKAQEVHSRLRILRAITSTNALRVDFTSEDKLIIAANSVFDALIPYKTPSNPTKGANSSSSNKVQTQGRYLSGTIERSSPSFLLEYHKVILSQCSNQNVSDSLKRWVTMQVCILLYKCTYQSLSILMIDGLICAFSSSLAFHNRRAIS
jgi:hypothetical protein